MTERLALKCREHNINMNLINYMEANIYPQYTNVDKGHQMPHIEQVIDRSLDFADYCTNELGMDIDYDMVYTIASYHDVGLAKAPRNIHEAVSATMLMEDEDLAGFFKSGQIKEMSEAVADHRASMEGDPRSIYGKIVSQADRCYDNFSDYLVRCCDARIDKNMTMQEIAIDCHDHLVSKFGDNGYSYSKVYFPDKNLDKFKKDADEVLSGSMEDYCRKFEAKVKANKARSKLQLKADEIDKNCDDGSKHLADSLKL